MRNGTICPYCERPLEDYSRDHIFPGFLGGGRKIPACKPCNDIFGSTFEARAAAVLYRVQVSMATWGLSFTQAPRMWRRALTHMGREYDISVEDAETKLRISSPIKEDGGDGRLAAISFGNKAEAERAVRRARRKGYVRATVQKIGVEMPAPHIPFEFDLGPGVVRTALKMCYALGTTLLGFNLAEVAHARAILKGDPNSLPPNVIPSFEVYESLDAVREPLSHVIYVERDETRVYGVVQFFGVLQLYCGLGRPDGSAPAAARAGVLDPLTGAESFFDPEPLRLKIPSIVGEDDLPEAAGAWLKRFQDGAVSRGATEPVNLAGTLSYRSVQ